MRLSEPRAISHTRLIDREAVITLIKLMLSLNQREQALQTYKLANETWPEWNLREALREAMK